MTRTLDEKILDTYAQEESGGKAMKLKAFIERETLRREKRDARARAQAHVASLPAPQRAAAQVGSGDIGSGRHNTITSIGTAGLPSSEDWRCEVVVLA